MVLERLEGETFTFWSANSIQTDESKWQIDPDRRHFVRNYMTDEFLQTLHISGMPLHKLDIK